MNVTFDFERIEDFAVATQYISDGNSVRIHTVFAQDYMEEDAEGNMIPSNYFDLIDVEGFVVQEFDDAETILMGRIYDDEGRIRESVIINGVYRDSEFEKMVKVKENVFRKAKMILDGSEVQN